MTSISYISLLLIFTSLLACKTGGSGRREDHSRDVAKDPETVGGIIDGNTGELATTKNNPWFVGREPVRYCVQFGADTIAATNPAVQKSIVEQVDAAFAKWVDLLHILKPVTPGVTQATNGQFLAGNDIANLTRDFKRVECDAHPEMQVRIGTWSKSDTEFLKYTSRYTVAYALRTAYAEETGRSRGFIWLVADSGPRRYKGPAPEGGFWSQDNYVHNVVLHELGHVFGIDHLPSTVMDAGFPAGVLASKLTAAWDLGDFKAMKGLDEEQCGELYHSEEKTEEALIKDVFGVEPATVKNICWRPAEDRRRSDDDGTPMLLWLKDVDGKKVVEQLLYVDGLYGDTRRISGNYLKKVADNDYRYSAITHLYYSPSDLFRMRFERGGRQIWVEAEAIAPAFVAFRFAYSGDWKMLGALLVPLEQQKALTKAIQAASFEEDAILDD